MQSKLSCILIESIHKKLEKTINLYKPHKTESIFGEVIMSKITNNIVGCIYRHPDDNIDDSNTKNVRTVKKHIFTW